MEKAASAAMEQTSTVIKKTGIFDRVDTLYGDPMGAEGESGGDAAGGDMGGDTGGDDFGGGSDFGADLAGGMDDAAATDAGGEAAAAEAGAAVESIDKKENLLMEEKQREVLNSKVKKYQNMYFKRLMESIDENEKVFNVENLDDEVNTINSKIEEMSKEIDSIIENEEK